MSLVLTNAGEKLEIVAWAVVPFTAHYADYVGATPAFTPGVVADNTIIGTKDLLAAPGSGQRVVRTISVYNNSGGANAIAIQVDDGGVNYTIVAVILSDEYSLYYDEDGWKVLDSDGALATTLFEHDILGPHHGDTTTDAVTRGSMITGNATPAWDELVHPGTAYHLQTDANDVVWAQDITMADGAAIGIGAGAEEITFNAAGDISVTGATLSIKALVTTPGGTLVLDGAGAITVTHSYHDVDTFGGAATDNLDTINGGVNGQILILRSTNSARDTTLTQAGNIWLDTAGNFTLTSVADRITLQHLGGSWYEISRSNNN